MPASHPESPQIPVDPTVMPGSPGTRARIDPIIGAVVGGVVIICVLLFLVIPQVSLPQAGVPAATCGERTLAYINKNLVSAGTTATLVSVEDTHGMYRVTVAYQGNTIPLYATRDCTLLFMEGMNMTGTAGRPATVTPTPSATPVKTARPVVNLYVMSYCPYGTQAEAAMKPVVDLMGSKAEIRVRFITRVGGTTVDSVESLHGPVEAREDLRQACIQKYFPGEFWSYLAGFNSQCYASARTPESAAACSRNVTSSLGVEQEKIDACATGSEGIGLLSGDEVSAAGQGVTASPTLFINGVKYLGSRAPEAYKQAVCGSFESTPPECQTVLSTREASAGGSC